MPIVNGRSYLHFIADHMERKKRREEKEKSIRFIKKEDIPLLVEMGKENFSEIYPLNEMDCLQGELEDAFEEDWWGKPKYLVIEFMGVILGFGGFRHSAMDDGMYEIVWININNKFRGNNIGTFLMEKLIAEIKKTTSCKDDLTILLSCQNHLEKFYNKVGFKKILKKVSGKEMIMALNINTKVKPKLDWFSRMIRKHRLLKRIKYRNLMS